MSNINPELVLGVFDFNLFGPAFFDMLRKLCALARKTVNESLVVFNATAYLSVQLTPEAELVVRATSFLTTFQTRTPKNFQQVLQLNRDITQSNQLLTASFTNAVLRYVSLEDASNTVPPALETWWINSLDPTCNCGTSSVSCIRTFQSYYQSIFSQSGEQAYFILNQTIKGLYLGCVPLETALQSSVECLFDPPCLLLILIALKNYTIGLGGSLELSSIQPLSAELLLHFQPSTSLLDIIQALMIEKWTSMIDFDSYFAQCHPKVCIYTFKQRFNLINTIVTLTGLAGGLSVALRILTPLPVRLVRRRSALQNSMPRRIASRFGKKISHSRT